MKTELSVLNKERKTNGIKWHKVAHGDPDVTGTWGSVRSDKRHGYSLGATHVQLGDLRCAIARVMGTRELPVMTQLPCREALAPWILLAVCIICFDMLPLSLSTHIDF